ncbi:MAG: DNA polymerase IV [Planctomycetes bacterium]|nr:DNA polymerase IV [Planctomycetota bacterium]MBI3846078.1 DNA polymerase IV [Planctomycetota bacterium]
MAKASRTILHVDMDAFYASVEQRDRPELRGKPVIVAGDARRGVVLAASYEARPFGVRSAMPAAQALKLCPHGVFLPMRMGRYAEVSRDVFAIFRRYTPIVEPLSLDEAFLDVTACRRLFGDGATIARRIKDDVRRELRLTASAGVASCKFVAKVASDLRKPDGLVTVEPGREVEFLAPLAIERMWGVGEVAAERLHAMGIRTIGDLQRPIAASLGDSLGELGTTIRTLALGIDDRPVVPDASARSIGAEDTFSSDVAGVAALRPHVQSQAERVARRVRGEGIEGRVVVLKVKLAEKGVRGKYRVLTRRVTLDVPTADGATIFRAAAALLEAAPIAGRRVRLTGVSMSDFRDSGRGQLLLFDSNASGRERASRLNRTMDHIERKFGPGAIRRGVAPPDDSRSWGSTDEDLGESRKRRDRRSEGE